MSCSKFRTDVAMYAGGDLPAARMARLESHLAECADCRGLDAELRAGLALLGELRDQPLEDAMVLQVRQRVMAQVGGAGFRRPARLYWKLALAAALVLAAVLAWPRHAAQPHTAAPVARAEPSRVTPAPQVNVIPVRHRVMRRRRRPAAVSQSGPPLLVQFVTDDPNIVIYWLVNQKPQGD